MRTHFLPPTTPDAMKIREDIHSYLSTLYMAHHLLREQVNTTGWYRIARIRSLIEKGASAEATLTAITRVVNTPIYAKGRGKRLEGK